MSESFSLAFDLRFEDLYRRDGLVRLDGCFVEFLKRRNADLHNRLMAGRAAPEGVAGKDYSDLIVELAVELEDFIAALFGIARDVEALRTRHDALAPLYAVKRLFVQRRAAKKYSPEQAAAFDWQALAAQLETLIGGALTELRFAQRVEAWMKAEAEHAAALDLAAQYAAWATHTPQGQHRHRDGVLFKLPRKIDPHRLVPVETEVVDGIAMLKLPASHRRARDGFALTDQGTDLAGALDHANYCIWCHNQGKDSCAKGLREKSGEFKKSAFGVVLAGCPLEEKISEMNLVEAGGHTVGALAVVVLDNPMCAATGHRICNDCMKACIYQKQEPVDIPQVETRVLKEVLALPWGFEIYGLLTRWNPLDLRRPVPKPSTGRKVLVVGLGPAGFTLAHHLINDGQTVVAVDGLKIEPLEPGVSGVAVSGARSPFRPIRDIAELREPLDARVMAGFGGVAEYGITVRWDKNFLKLIRLLLERRGEFAMFGGVRFGGTLTIDGAFALGFDHIAFCAGAGRPTIVAMKNGLAAGVRQASDFLMALQLTGAAKTDSLANLQVRLPVVIIGGGLTAIDTATEALAYYPLQVEKFLSRYETLIAERGEAAVRADWSAQEVEAASEFMQHAREIRAERALAVREGRKPQLAELMRRWGGATIVYRRRLIDSPSYTLNHEEVGKALEEGIAFAERLTPQEVLLDGFGCARALRLSEAHADASAPPRDVVLPARTVLVAAGTQPNTVLAREEPQHVRIDGKYFQAVDENGGKVTPERVTKPSAAHVLMSVDADGRAISFFGDLHPSFAGNVVKAMASAKQGYPVVSRMLARQRPSQVSPAALIARLNEELRPTVQEVNRLTPSIVEVVVRAPMAARAFAPGQFYRLQNYETLSRDADGTRLAKEGLALTGAAVDRERGLLSTIVLEMGGSSDLCAQLAPGEPVVLMGPTGHPTETPSGETVLLIGGGLGNAVLFSIGQALRRNGSRVLYFAGYKRAIDRYKVDEIERAADAIVWCCDEPPGFGAERAQDKAFIGNIVAALDAYGSGALGETPIALGEVDRVVAIGSDGMMAAVSRARQGMLAQHLKPGHKAIASINSPMQCMMKEICAQCLQVHRDPASGVESVVFSCFNQDQDLDRVDFDNLRARLNQNGVQEKLTRLWIDRSLRQLGLRQAAE
ncbi:MAG: pyridine nucleotide-disulfide oxidoreductase [Alphaproteobacteria bacterium]|nr:MAG: pyridine nucleotide-disulfide oxidoreductase [Alphaproteobacteria bacterium]